MIYNTPTTELEAVNLMLISVGESPVNTIDATGLTEAQSALLVLRGVGKAIQGAGLYCNTDIDYALTKETDNQIRVPQGTLRVLIKNTQDNQYALRGRNIYDRLNNTYEHSDDLVASKLVTALAFEDLPEYVRDLIMIKSLRQYQSYKLQDGSMHSFTKEDEYRAWRTFKELEDEHHEVNLLDDAYVYYTGGYRYRRRT